MRTIEMSAKDMAPRVARVSGISLRALAGFMSLLSCYVGNDTGTLHLAAALGLPTLGLYGPTDPAIWAPVSPLVRTVRAPGENLDRLPFEHVKRQLDTSLPMLCADNR